MNERRRDLLLDCMSYLWTLSKRAEDYWHQVASMEHEEALSYFSSLIKHPTQLGSLFGQMSRDESTKIYNSLVVLTHRPSSLQPSFFETSLWAAIIDVKSTTMRREFFRLSLEVDVLSRRLVGSSSELSEAELTSYLELTKKYISISRHIHPAFSHSDRSLPNIEKKEYAVE